MRRWFIWASLVLAILVLVGIALQLYFIAAWTFGSSGALSAHKDVGGVVVHPLEILTFVAALIGWWGTWRNVLWSLALPVLGTIQIFFVGDLEKPEDGWVHGFHGGLVLFVIAAAALIVAREADALAVRRTRGSRTSGGGQAATASRPA